MASDSPSLCVTTEVQHTVEVTTAECSVPSLGEIAQSGYHNTEETALDDSKDAGDLHVHVEDSRGETEFLLVQVNQTLHQLTDSHGCFSSLADVQTFQLTVSHLMRQRERRRAKRTHPSPQPTEADQSKKPRTTRQEDTRVDHYCRDFPILAEMKKKDKLEWGLVLTLLQELLDRKKRPHKRFQRFYAQIQGFESLPYSQLPSMITSCFSEEKILTALANLRLCDQDQQPEDLSSPSLPSP